VLQAAQLAAQDMKVAQLAGYVAEVSEYHHAETALAAASTGMAQTFVDANNMPLLMPNGQFATRLMGGKDAASPRDIFTRLSPLALTLFPADDAPLLDYLRDDGTSVEPRWYAPVLPTALLNGVKGIAPGFSCEVPP
jgi:DNA topoisomerase-2